MALVRGERREQDVKRGDDKVPGPWLRRVQVAPDLPQAVPEELASEGSTPADESDRGWDPYDVWLRRVHLPRQHRES